MFLFLISIFVIVHAPNGDYAVKYEGMDKSTITKAQEFPFDFVDKTTFDAFNASKAAQEPTPASDPIKSQAILDAKDRTKTADQRLDALIKVIDLK